MWHFTWALESCSWLVTIHCRAPVQVQTCANPPRRDCTTLAYFPVSSGWPQLQAYLKGTSSIIISINYTILSSIYTILHHFLYIRLIVEFNGSFLPGIMYKLYNNSLHKTCTMYRIVYTKLSHSLLSQCGIDWILDILPILWETWYSLLDCLPSAVPRVIQVYRTTCIMKSISTDIHLDYPRRSWG